MSGRGDEEDTGDDLVTDGLAEDALKQLKLALDGDLRPLTPAVFIPPGVRMMLADSQTGRGIIEQHLKDTYKEPTVQEMVVRIQREVDPIGMAAAIVQGMAIPVYVPKDGKIVVKYVQVSTRERLKLLNQLMARVLPAESPRKAAKPEEPDAGVLNPNRFLDMVRQAADMVQQRRLEAAPRNITPPDKSYSEAELVVEATTNPPPERV